MQRGFIMKIIRKIASVFFAVLMIASLLTMATFAAPKNGKDGKTTIHEAAGLTFEGDFTLTHKGTQYSFELKGNKAVCDTSISDLTESNPLTVTYAGGSTQVINVTANGNGNGNDNNGANDNYWLAQTVVSDPLYNVTIQIRSIDMLNAAGEPTDWFDRTSSDYVTLSSVTKQMTEKQLKTFISGKLNEGGNVDTTAFAFFSRTASASVNNTKRVRPG